MGTIRTEQTRLLQDNGTENIEFFVYDKDGVAKTTLNQTKDVLKQIPSNLSPINSNLSVEYLRPLRDAIKTTTSEDSQLLNKNPNFNPLIFSTNKDLLNRFGEKVINKSFDISSIDLSDINNLPNFFKLQISLSLFSKKMNLSKIQIAISLLALFIVMTGPRYFIYKNNTNAKIYSSSTFSIFKAIDKDVNRVIAPKSQIDQILEQLPESNFSSVELPNLDIFLQYGSKYISDISIDVNTSAISIKINSMPDFQFNTLKNNAKRFNINIINDDLDSIDGFINGILKVGYRNE